MQQSTAIFSGRKWRLIASLLMLAALILPLVQPQPALAQEKPRTSGVEHTGTGPTNTCPFSFLDVHTTDYFYDGVRYLFCMGAVSGYADGTFRPGNGTTRGQLSKIVVSAMLWPLVSPPVQSFSDVPPGSTFYPYVETAKAHGAIGGYPDGTFHPENPVTRGQLAKMVVMAQGWPLLDPPAGQFNDVPPGSSFYTYVETAAARGTLSGYADGSFRPGNPTTRGQVVKVVYYASTSQLTPQEQETVNIINQRRAALGLVTLRIDPALSRAARRHASDIGPLGLCQHNGTDGSSPWDRAAQAGYTGFAMGEVVGCGYPTALGVVDGWWASQGHHDILVGPDARDIGCGWWTNASGYGWQACLTGTSTP
ncbi:MAG: S-layer homology domain-containing protein [Chloroflexota bacterium]